MKHPDVERRAVICNRGISEVFQTSGGTSAAHEEAVFIFAIRIGDVDDSLSFGTYRDQGPQVDFFGFQSRFGTFRFQSPLETNTTAPGRFVDQFDYYASEFSVFSYKVLGRIVVEPDAINS